MVALLSSNFAIQSLVMKNILHGPGMYHYRSDKNANELRQELNNCDDPVFIVDCDHLQILFANTSALNTLGYAMDELIDLDFTSITKHYTKEILQVITGSMQLPGQHAALPTTIVAKDRSLLQVQLFLERTIEDGQHHLLATAVLNEGKWSHARGGEMNEQIAQVKEMLERVSDLVIALDDEGRYIYLNKKALDVLGKPTEELLGKNIWDVFPLTKQTQFYNVVNEAWTTQQYQSHLGFNPELNKWFEVHLYPSATGISIYAQDVTGRIEGDNALRKSEQQYRTIVETAQEGIWQVDEHMITNFINPYMASLLGVDPNEMIGRHALDFLPEHTHAQIRQSAELLKSLKSLTNQFVFVNKENKTVYAHVRSTALYNNGEYTGAISMVLDVTSIRSVEDELRSSEMKYRVMFESNPLPMFIITYPDRIFLDVNEAMVNKFGYSREEFLKMDVRQLRPPGEQYKSYEIEAILQKQGHTRQNLHLCTSTGADLYFEGQFIKLSLEEKPLYLASLNDITERVKAEEDLVKMNEQLRSLASHLEDVREEERTAIAREIHDELGQLLTVLKMDISWLYKRAQGDETYRERLANALQLVNDTIQSVRKISSQLRPSLLDHLGLAEAMKWQCEELMRRTEISIAFDTNIEDEKFSADISNALYRVQQEAFTNIVRHADATHVDCVLQKNDDQLTLTVADNGRGFDIQQQNHRKTFGLVGIKERVTMLHGRYNITSEPGLGTTISVEIPLHRDD